MIKRKKEVLIGIVVGVIATCIGMFFYSLYSASASNLKQETAIKVFIEQGKLGHLISMGAILNLIAFFIFIKRKQDYRARGVLMATIFTAIIVLILQFI